MERSRPRSSSSTGSRSSDLSWNLGDFGPRGFLERVSIILLTDCTMVQADSSASVKEVEEYASRLVGKLMMVTRILLCHEDEDTIYYMLVADPR